MLLIPIKELSFLITGAKVSIYFKFAIPLTEKILFFFAKGSSYRNYANFASNIKLHRHEKYTNCTESDGPDNPRV